MSNRHCRRLRLVATTKKKKALLRTSSSNYSMRHCCLLLLFLSALLLLPSTFVAAAASRGNEHDPANNNNNNNNVHAIIVSSSRYWFNYRHAINALGMYEIFRQNGVLDENIILMIADEYFTNARNPYKNRMHAEGIHTTGWYHNQTEVDYRGSDVTVQNFMDALFGLAPKSLKNLNEDSSLTIYLSGHGGNQFFKFQDEEEIMAQDIANLMDRLREEKKFKKALIIADTCQAFTMFDKVTTPNVLALGTSLIDENAYAHHTDSDLGLGAIERWTYHFIEYYKRRANHLTTLHQAMVSPFDNRSILMSRVGIKEGSGTSTDSQSQGMSTSTTFKDTKLSEFFGIKGGRKSPTTATATANSGRFQEIDTSPESLLKLPPQQQHLRDEETSTFFECTTNEHVCSAGEDNDSQMKLSGNGFHFFTSGGLLVLLATLVVARKVEKLFLEK
mmetsp:Transcript_24748/g.54322  ORF Transcript_24748/g.54322 Transcript_24748/m.54322 type:complete len:446 (+) Transcript_24748:271-1608(+)